MTPSDWQHFKDDRRRMAWIALAAIPLSRAFELSPLVPLDRLEKLADPTCWFYLTMASIVGA
jgi:hypothetical protein